MTAFALTRRYRRPPLARLATPFAIAAALLVPTAAWGQDAASEGLRPTTDPASQLAVAAVLLAVFVLLTREAAHRVLIAGTAAALLWAITYLTPLKLLPFDTTGAVLDLNVLVLLGAMMALVGVLKSTGVFGWAVGRIVARSGGRPAALLRLVAWLTAILSAFLDNVTTVVFVTPIVIEVARRLRMRPTAFLLPVVMAANVGGTATLIGDPPNIMIGSAAHITFMQFVENLTVPCLVMMLVLEWYAARYFAGDIASARPEDATEFAARAAAIDNPQLLRWMLGISAVVLTGFVAHGVTGMPAAVPAIIGAAAALVVQDLLYLRRHRPTESERRHGLLEIVERDVEWPTLMFFGFLFIIVGAAVQTGLVGTIATALSWAIAAVSDVLRLSPDATLLAASLLVLWVSGVLSALIDNIPFVAVMIPIIAQLTRQLGGDTLALWWALSLGACLGGNGTAVGASANVTVIGLAEKAGVRITFAEFTRFGAAVTVATLLISSVYLALFIYAGGTAALAVGLAVLAAAAVGRRTVRARRARLQQLDGAEPRQLH